MTLSEQFSAHCHELERRANAGDVFALESLCCIALLTAGWRYGEPEPVAGPDPAGGGQVLRLADFSRAVPVLRLVRPD